MKKANATDNVQRYVDHSELLSLRKKFAWVLALGSALLLISCSSMDNVMTIEYCETQRELHAICGLHQPEDMVLIPDTKTLLIRDLVIKDGVDADNKSSMSHSNLALFDVETGAMGLKLGDVVKMTVFLVGVPELQGRLDFAGFMKAYRHYFGTQQQPHLPARSAVQVAGLAGLGMLVEIEVVVARTGQKSDSVTGEH